MCCDPNTGEHGVRIELQRFIRIKSDISGFATRDVSKYRLSCRYVLDERESIP
jgi:hypothetical protein